MKTKIRMSIVQINRPDNLISCFTKEVMKQMAIQHTARNDYICQGGYVAAFDIYLCR